MNGLGTAGEDPFRFAWEGIEHAQRRINELEWEATAWINSKPCARVVETDPDSAQEVHKIKVVKPMPVGLSHIAFDAGNSLRAALDRAGSAVANAIKPGSERGKFPFADTSEKLSGKRTRPKGGSHDLPEEIFDVMVSFQPYKRGNTLLWAVNQLANANKHAVVVPIVMTNGFLVVNRGPGLVTHRKGGVIEWDPVKQEMELFATLPGYGPNYQLDFTAYIIIGDIEGLERIPAVDAHHRMSIDVTRAVGAIRDKAREIGVFR
jgi:hypothetical protein